MISKFYRANTELKEHLISLGLIFHSREEKYISYYTDHNSGKQVRIDKENRLIAFLSPEGNSIEEENSFTSKQIKNFLN
jgi:hypothetical protein